MKEALFAFWRYSSYPFVLGGTITKLYEDGSVAIKEYGGKGFRPILIVPLAAGKKRLKELEQLRANHRKAQEGLTKHWQERLDELFPEFTQK